MTPDAFPRPSGAAPGDVSPIIWGYCGHVDPVALVAALRASSPNAPLQVFDAAGVFGVTHLGLAARLAARAFRQARARARDLATETLVYAAGERQVMRAIERLGVRPTTTTFAVAAWGPEAEAAAAALADGFGWSRDDSVLAGDATTLERLDIKAPAEWPSARWDELVWERVALVDVLKP